LLPAAAVVLAGLAAGALTACAPESPPHGSASAPETAAPAGLRERLRQSLAEEGVDGAEAEAALAAFDGAIGTAGFADTPPERIPGSALDPAVKTLLARFRGRPATQAALLHSVAVALQGAGRFAEAVPLEENALAARRRLLGDDHPATLASLSTLGSLLNSAGRLDDALPLLREAVERSRRVLGGDDPETLGAMNSAAAVLWRKGELGEAQVLLREALAGCRRALGNDHPFTLTAANNLGVLLTEAGRPDEAIPLCREALDGRRRILGDDHALTLQSMDSMVQALRADRRLDEAIAQARELLDRGTLALGEEHVQTLLWTTTLGTLHLDAGQPGEALAVLAPAEAAARRALPGREPRRFGIFLAALGLAQARTGELDAAGAALDEARIVLEDPAVGSTSDVTYVLSNLEELEAAWHEADPGAGHGQAAAERRDEVERLRGDGASPPRDP
jgi:non-specific serine/threonine protein kinase/serine/threonine-protein kinase